MIGIYKIENLITHQKYVGQSKDIEVRWKQEKGEAFNANSRNFNSPLSQDIRKYGLNNFSFEIIEQCEVSQLNEREIYWIAFFDSYHNGYNRTVGGGYNSQRINSDLIAIIKEELKNTNLLHREIAEKYKVSIGFVQGINTGIFHFDESEIYPLQKQQKGHATTLGPRNYHYYCEECNAEISRGARLCVQCYNKTRHIVSHPNREQLKQDIRNLSFLEIGRKYGVSDNAIRKWCKGYNLPHQKTKIKTFTEEEWEKI